MRKKLVTLLSLLLIFSCKPSENKNKDSLVVLWTNGGISSQMNFYARYKYFEELGYNVKFDMKWFDDFNKVHPNDSYTRNFDLLKAFPSIKISIANESEIKTCKENNYINTDEIKAKGLESKLVEFVKPNTYITGYSIKRSASDYWDFFRERFNPELDEKNKKWLNLILEDDKNSCGVHVRRGDLSTYNEAYGDPVPADYFISAIKFLYNKNPNMSFYFFSEEVDWIRDNIIPYIDKEIKYHIVDANNAGTGYLDLFLLSKCKYIIGSQGSFGRFAYNLSYNSKFIDYYENKNSYKDGKFKINDREK